MEKSYKQTTSWRWSVVYKDVSTGKYKPRSSLYQVQNCQILSTEVLKPIFVFSEFELDFKNKRTLFVCVCVFP